LIRKLILALATALLAVPAAAQKPPPPKLLVVIRVDGLSSELFGQYRAQFTGGFAQLGSGTTFLNAAAAAPAGPALGDLMKMQWPATRSVSVSGNRVADPSEAGQRFYWDGNRFATLSAALAPPVVDKVNAAIAAALAQPRPPLEPTPFCASQPAKGGGLGRPAGDAARLAASPELDGDTLALAGGLIDAMQLGRGSAPDIVTVGLAATGNVARTYGSRSQEMCLQLTELDREIGDFLSLLDSRGVDYAVALEGAGQAQVPIFFWRPGFKGASVSTPVSTNDVVPTLATLVELPLSPAPTGGRCLEGTPAFCPRLSF
jgi:hypothetical protein